MEDACKNNDYKKRIELFYELAPTSQKNICVLVNNFQDNGLTLDKYIQACIKQPPLFCLTPDTIEANVRELVERFKDNGLTLDKYVEACIKQPQLFYQSPDTIEANIRGLVERFKDSGLTIEKYIPACIKQPSLFCHTPDTIARHIDIIRFSKCNTNHDIDTTAFWDKLLSQPIELAFSNKLLLIKYLIIPKMFEDGSIPKELKGNHLEMKLEEYIKSHPFKQFDINLKQPDTNTDCIGLLEEYINELSQKTGKDNIFNINIVE